MSQEWHRHIACALDCLKRTFLETHGQDARATIEKARQNLFSKQTAEALLDFVHASAAEVLHVAAEFGRVFFNLF